MSSEYRLFSDYVVEKFYKRIIGRYEFLKSKKWSPEGQKGEPVIEEIKQLTIQLEEKRQPLLKFNNSTYKQQADQRIRLENTEIFNAKTKAFSEFRKRQEKAKIAKEEKKRRETVAKQERVKKRRTIVIDSDDDDDQVDDGLPVTARPFIRNLQRDLTGSDENKDESELVTFGQTRLEALQTPKERRRDPGYYARTYQVADDKHYSPDTHLTTSNPDIKIPINVVRVSSVAIEFIENLVRFQDRTGRFGLTKPDIEKHRQETMDAFTFSIIDWFVVCARFLCAKRANIDFVTNFDQQIREHVWTETASKFPDVVQSMFYLWFIYQYRAPRVLEVFIVPPTFTEFEFKEPPNPLTLYQMHETWFIGLIRDRTYRPPVPDPMYRSYDGSRALISNMITKNGFVIKDTKSISGYLNMEYCMARIRQMLVPFCEERESKQTTLPWTISGQSDNSFDPFNLRGLAFLYGYYEQFITYLTDKWYQVYKSTEPTIFASARTKAIFERYNQSLGNTKSEEASNRLFRNAVNTFMTGSVVHGGLYIHNDRVTLEQDQQRDAALVAYSENRLIEPNKAPVFPLAGATMQPEVAIRMIIRMIEGQYDKDEKGKPQPYELASSWLDLRTKITFYLLDFERLGLLDGTHEAIDTLRDVAMVMRLKERIDVVAKRDRFKRKGARRTVYKDEGYHEDSDDTPEIASRCYAWFGDVDAIGPIGVIADTDKLENNRKEESSDEENEAVDENSIESLVNVDWQEFKDIIERDDADLYTDTDQMIHAFFLFRTPAERRLDKHLIREYMKTLVNGKSPVVEQLWSDVVNSNSSDTKELEAQAAKAQVFHDNVLKLNRFVTKNIDIATGRLKIRMNPVIKKRVEDVIRSDNAVNIQQPSDDDDDKKQVTKEEEEEPAPVFVLTPETGDDIYLTWFESYTNMDELKGFIEDMDTITAMYWLVLLDSYHKGDDANRIRKRFHELSIGWKDPRPRAAIEYWFNDDGSYKNNGYPEWFLKLRQTREASTPLFRVLHALWVSVWVYNSTAQYTEPDDVIAEKIQTIQDTEEKDGFSVFFDLQYLYNNLTRFKAILVCFNPVLISKAMEVGFKLAVNENRKLQMQMDNAMAEERRHLNTNEDDTYQLDDDVVENKYTEAEKEELLEEEEAEDSAAEEEEEGSLTYSASEAEDNEEDTAESSDDNEEEGKETKREEEEDHKVNELLDQDEDMAVVEPSTDGLSIEGVETIHIPVAKQEEGGQDNPITVSDDEEEEVEVIETGAPEVNDDDIAVDEEEDEEGDDDDDDASVDSGVEELLADGSGTGSEHSGDEEDDDVDPDETESDSDAPTPEPVDDSNPKRGRSTSPDDQSPTKKSKIGIDGSGKMFNF